MWAFFKVLLSDVGAAVAAFPAAWRTSGRRTIIFHMAVSSWESIQTLTINYHNYNESTV